VAEATAGTMNGAPRLSSDKIRQLKPQLDRLQREAGEKPA
jgi:hypothetical protein